jgi:type VI secretion system protein ImpA
MINLEPLLEPISADAPSGEDLSYDPAMQELETLLQGKPETQFSAAEEPRWDHVRDRAVELLGRSKNLRLAIILCLALLRTEGIAGFHRGLELIRAWLERYWDTLYPRLDPDDNNDPTERVNILASLVTPIGSFADPMQFLRRVREAKLSESPRIGRFSLEEIAPSSGADGAAGASPVDPTQAQASFRDTPRETLDLVMNAVTGSIGTAKAIDQLLTSTIGADRAPDWSALLVTLQEVRNVLAPYVGQSVETDGESDSGQGGQSGGGGGSGNIQSRQDVIRTLDRLCDYYSRAEPSSPVPLLLRRAQRLAEMNFLEIIGDLSPEALAPVQNVTGVKPAAPAAES